MKKKLIATLLLAMAICLLPAAAFADSAETKSGSIAVMHAKDGTDITLRNHTDVIIREKASLTARRLHTLYIGDTVHIIKWIYGTADDYDWSYISHYDIALDKVIYGVAASCYLS